MPYRRRCRRWLEPFAEPVGDAVPEAPHHALLWRLEANAITDDAHAQRAAENLGDDRQGAVRALSPVIAAQRDARIIEADPGTGNELRVQQDEPAVGIILRRSGLARDVGADAETPADGSTGTAIDDAAQGVEQRVGDLFVENGFRRFR